MNRKILLFGVDDNQQEKIKSFCSSFSVEVSPVEKKDCNQTIGSLAGIPKAKNTFGRMSRGKTASTGKAADANCDMPAFSEPMDADPAVLEYFIFSFTADFGEVIQDLIAEEAE